MDSFSLEGITYFQQGRKCNKPGCACASGALHGPYWFTRDTSGKVKYLGKSLPKDVEDTRLVRDSMTSTMQSEIDELQTKIAAVRRLMAGHALTHDDYLIVKDLGFGDALLSGRT